MTIFFYFSSGNQGKDKTDKKEVERRNIEPCTSMLRPNPGSSGGAGDGDGEEERPTKKSLPQDKISGTDEDEDTNTVSIFNTQIELVEHLPENPELNKPYHLLDQNIRTIQHDLREHYVENPRIRKQNEKYKKKDPRLIGRTINRQYECKNNYCQAKVLIGPAVHPIFMKKGTSMIRTVIFMNEHSHPIPENMPQMSPNPIYETISFQTEVCDPPNFLAAEETLNLSDLVDNPENVTEDNKEVEERDSITGPSLSSLYADGSFGCSGNKDKDRQKVRGTKKSLTKYGNYETISFQTSECDQPKALAAQETPNTCDSSIFDFRDAVIIYHNVLLGKRYQVLRTLPPPKLKLLYIIWCFFYPFYSLLCLTWIFFI
jgi:hypothetical protein